MELEYGTFRVEASAPGHQTLRRWVEFDGSGLVPSIVLRPLPPSVRTQPKPVE